MQPGLDSYTYQWGLCAEALLMSALCLRPKCSKLVYNKGWNCTLFAVRCRWLLLLTELETSAACSPSLMMLAAIQAVAGLLPPCCCDVIRITLMAYLSTHWFWWRVMSWSQYAKDLKFPRLSYGRNMRYSQFKCAWHAGVLSSYSKQCLQGDIGCINRYF